MDIPSMKELKILDGYYETLISSKKLEIINMQKMIKKTKAGISYNKMQLKNMCEKKKRNKEMIVNLKERKKCD